MNIYIAFEIGGGSPLYGCWSPLYRREVHFSPVRRNIVDSETSLIVLKTEADIHFMDADDHLKNEFERRIALEPRTALRQAKKSEALLRFYRSHVIKVKVRAHFRKYWCGRETDSSPFLIHRTIGIFWRTILRCLRVRRKSSLHSYQIKQRNKCISSR